MCGNFCVLFKAPVLIFFSIVHLFFSLSFCIHRIFSDFLLAVFCLASKIDPTCGFMLKVFSSSESNFSVQVLDKNFSRVDERSEDSKIGLEDFFRKILEKCSRLT